MSQQEAIKQFESQKVRTYWDDEQEKWFFCINDVVSVLTDSVDVRQYIKRLRSRDLELDSVWGTICTPHQFRSTDGKMHAQNCTDLKGAFRIIQSIPSKKAEPIKQWMAAVAAERLHQMQDPERGIQISLLDYKHFKGLHQENLRDNMTNEELVMNMLAELTTTNIEKAEQPQSMSEHAHAAARGGEVAKVAREAFEQQTGKKVVSPLNAKDYFDSLQPHIDFEDEDPNEIIHKG